MQKFGTAESAVILCDYCRKRISVKGIQMQQVEIGEYSVSFFACPHCGEVYQVNTKDERQRELLERRAVALRRQAVATGRRFREKTLKRYRDEAKRVERELKERAAELRKIGEKILSDRRRTDEPENGNSRAESHQEY